jgi:phage tail sheath protein FI
MAPPPTFRVPGVYKEDIFAPRIEAVPTGVPAFLGLAQSGDVYVLKRCRSWNEFTREFGAPGEGMYLGYAVRGFFTNGGQDCHVMRLPDISESDLQSALGILETLDEIDLVCVPDLVSKDVLDEVYRLQDMLVTHCAKAGDRFAILDSHRDANDDPRVVDAHRNLLQSPESPAAIYYPWIMAPKESGLIGEHVLVPPCGHVAGVYARTDRIDGVHVAPANELLKGAVDVAVNLSKEKQAELNLPGAAGINILQAFPGRGIRVWGSRTLSTDPAWRYVHVRRLFISILRWIERNMSDIVFEPNHSRLWRTISRDLKAYLVGLYAQGAFKGETPDEAFYVKCDADTNPPEVRDQGWVVTEIGFAPIVPSEFIVVRLFHTDAGVVISGGPPLPTSGTAPADVSGSNQENLLPDVHISYIEYSAPGKDVDKEYVQIRNRSDGSVNMGNWTLCDEANHVFRFPAFTLRPDESVRVWTTRGTNTGADLYWGRSMAIWNNVGDEATLRDKNGQLIDAYKYVV